MLISMLCASLNTLIIPSTLCCLKDGIDEPLFVSQDFCFVFKDFLSLAIA